MVTLTGSIKEPTPVGVTIDIHIANVPAGWGPTEDLTFYTRGAGVNSGIGSIIEVKANDEIHLRADLRNCNTEDIIISGITWEADS